LVKLTTGLSSHQVNTRNRLKDRRGSFFAPFMFRSMLLTSKLHFVFRFLFASKKWRKKLKVQYDAIYSEKMQKRFNFSHLRQRFYGRDKDCWRFCQRNVQSVEALSRFMTKTFFNNLFFY
jgi:hypothetical protein